MATGTRARRRVLGPVVTVVAVLVVLTVAGCTTAVTGSGRPGTAGARSTPATTSPASSDVPSGAPAPVETRYPDSTPQERSYLYARDATYQASHGVAVAGTFTTPSFPGPTTVQGRYGFDAAAGQLVGRSTLTIGSTSAEVRGVGDQVWGLGPAAFWTAAGRSADQAGTADAKWVVLTTTFEGVGACESVVGFLSLFEPGHDDALTTRTQDVGGTTYYVVTDPTTGVETVIDRDTGTIAVIRTPGGDITVTYPDDDVSAAPPPADQVVTVPGF